MNGWGRIRSTTAALGLVWAVFAVGPLRAEDAPPLSEAGIAEAQRLQDESEAQPVAPVRVTAHVASADVVPGRPFELVVEVDRAEAATFELPDLGPKIQGLVVLDDKADPPERGGGRVLLRHRWTLKAPLSGTYHIPGIEAPWTTPDGQVGTAGSGPILIEAALRGGAEEGVDEGLRDIKAVVAPPWNPRPWMVGAATLLLLLGLGLWFWRRRRRKEPAPPVQPPHEVALRALGALLQDERLRDPGSFAFDLSEVLRRYLEGRFGFLAWRMTTAEVLRSMPRELAAQRKVEQAVREVLEASDRVKFARDVVTADELRAWADQVRDVVEATRPREEAP
jgi:hypothetical protein